MFCFRKDKSKTNMDAQSVRHRVYDLRVALVGDSDVGKTSISRVFTGDDKLKVKARPTIGYEFGFALRRYANGDSVRYIVVDTAGQERYSHALPNYMRDSDAVVLVYDVCVREGKKKAESHNMYFLESSAITGQQVHRIFDYLATEIRDRKLHELFHGTKKRLSQMAFKLPRPDQEEKKTGCQNCLT
ncbi:hypothetical protein EGW08_001078 [Elysia chlorotica]|uniref:Small monomeric GTPase n=1 Tax=Elysia chlorotica TaxID=188477 RepID=A0A3S1BXC7_ELYCH|nr:hypothetical protein EGW08_001078 [Elysia chlorotica]